MKPLTAKEVESILIANGFVCKSCVGSHFGWYNPLTGRRTIVAHHGNKTMPQGTLNAIFNQTGIPKPKR